MCAKERVVCFPAKAKCMVDRTLEQSDKTYAGIFLLYFSYFKDLRQTE